MTTPQVEHGYVRIANELYDQILLAPFSKRELLVVLAVIRKTYGYGKKSDDMTMTQIAEMTGLKRSHAGETVKALAQKNVFLIRDGEYGQLIGLSKNYRNWNFIDVPKTGHVPKTGNGCSQNGTHNRQLQKTNKNIDAPCSQNGNKRKSRLPDSFALTDERREVFERIAPHLDAGHEFERFRDYHEAKGSAFVSWDAAWRTWCRNAVKFNPPASTPDAFRGNL